MQPPQSNAFQTAGVAGAIGGAPQQAAPAGGMTQPSQFGFAGAGAQQPQGSAFQAAPAAGTQAPNGFVSGTTPPQGAYQAAGATFGSQSPQPSFSNGAPQTAAAGAPKFSFSITPEEQTEAASTTPQQLQADAAGTAGQTHAPSGVPLFSALAGSTAPQSQQATASGAVRQQQGATAGVSVQSGQNVASSAPSQAQAAQGFAGGGTQQPQNPASQAAGVTPQANAGFANIAPQAQSSVASTNGAANALGATAGGSVQSGQNVVSVTPLQAQAAQGFTGGTPQQPQPSVSPAARAAPQTNAGFTPSTPQPPQSGVSHSAGAAGYATGAAQPPFPAVAAPSPASDELSDGGQPLPPLEFESYDGAADDDVPPFYDSDAAATSFPPQAAYTGAASTQMQREPSPAMQQLAANVAPATYPAAGTQPQQAPFSSMPHPSAQSAPSTAYAPTSAAQPAPRADNGAVPSPATPAPQPAAVPAAALRDQLIARLTTEDAILAASLMRTGEWTQSGSVITAIADSVFLKSQLELQSTNIARVLGELCGQAVSFAVKVQQAPSAQSARTLPPEVLLVCSTFKGDVTSFAPRKEGEVRKQQEPQPAPHAAAANDEAADAQDYNDDTADEE